MRIAILTSGILPVPAVQGGAVENLIDFYTEYNDIHKLHDITIYSVYHPKTDKHKLQTSIVNHYHYIDTCSIWAKIKRTIYLHTYYKLHKNYNNHYIEYYFSEAIKDIKKKNFDIILLENRPSYALKLRRTIKTKLICHLHNELLNSDSKGANEIYNSLDKIITVSNYIANCVKTINPNDQKCITVYNGISLKSFTPNRKSSIKQEDLGLSEGDFVLVFSGRINKDKGILELIKAMSLVKDDHIKLLVIGGSFFGNDMRENEFIRNLKSIASPIKERILFTGYIPYEKMPDYLKISDVAVVPSIWNDPFPTTILEAQAMGLPIITTKNGGIPEEVTEDNAILLDTNKNFVESLAQSIIWLYEHPEERKQMGEKSLNHSKKFDKERFAKDFYNVISNSMSFSN
jgi:glycosyltransferase involved in cell wall biosynthesis